MTNRAPFTRAFTTRPATGSFLDLPTTGSNLDRPATLSYIDRSFERVVFLLGKRTLADRNKPR